MADTCSAHDHANNNQAEILVSSECACFGCYAVFPASDVTGWTDSTAWCPKCELGLVFGERNGLDEGTVFFQYICSPLTVAFSPSSEKPLRRRYTLS
ncbi:hypothetical protein PSCICL_17650 [Pseudomonas cichorii]|nr:hypothetical protein PSCICL_17650 [Pseudomonas cichorii]